MLPWWCARHWYLPATEDFDDAHGATAAGAGFAQGEWDDLGLWLWNGSLFGALDAEQGTDLCDVGLAGRTGQQTVVPDAMKAFRQHMDQTAADKCGFEVFFFCACSKMCNSPSVMPSVKDGAVQSRSRVGAGADGAGSGGSNVSGPGDRTSYLKARPSLTI